MAKELQRAIVREKIDHIAESHGLPPDQAHLRLVFALTTGESYGDLDPEDIVDGGGDRQLDIVTIDDSSDDHLVTVTVIQASVAESMSSNKLQLMGGGLDWLLAEPKDRYLTLTNVALREKIKDFRSVRREVGAHNVAINCYFATLGDAEDLSDEFLQELERVRDRFRGGHGDFNFQILGVSELTELMRSQDPRQAPVNERIEIIYSVNQPSVLKHTAQGAHGLVCTVKAGKISEIVNAHTNIFEKNLRRFLQYKGSVNQAIRATCTSEDESQYFWFLNNGITIICDRVDLNLDPDHPYVEVQNLQIINGCQTSSTLARCLQEGVLREDTRVLVKIFQSEDPDLIPKVILGTNSQNKITSRDLKANDNVQETLQQAFQEKFGLYVERRANEYANLGRDRRSKIVSNEKIGQASLGLLHKRPSDARRRKYKIWGDDYNRVFNENTLPQAYLLAFRIVEMCNAWKRIVFSDYENDLLRRVLANGVYHVSRGAAFMWRQHDAWHDEEELSRQIVDLSDDPQMLDEFFVSSLEAIAEIIRGDASFAADDSAALKSSRLDDEFTRKLHRDV